MNKILLFLIPFVILSCSEEIKQPKEEVNDLHKKYKVYKPADLIIDAFKTKDVIFLGEQHRIKEQAEFVKNIIPVLHQNGVHILYSEFVNYGDSILVDSLINSELFNVTLAREITGRSLLEWNYREYVDILEAVWRINKTSDIPFRIIGMVDEYNWSAIEKEEDWGNKEKRMAFFRETEADHAKRIIAETIEKGAKALVHCGTHHAITHYAQPLVDKGEFYGLAKNNDRVGQNVYLEYPDKTITIWLHHSWENKTMEAGLIPLQGYLETFVDSFTDEYRSFGFYTDQSSLGSIIDSNSYYSQGYENLTLKDVCHGYIVLKPVCDLNFVGEIEGFVTESWYEQAKEQVRTWEGYEDLSIEAINDTLLNWYIVQFEEFFRDRDRLCED